MDAYSFETLVVLINGVEIQGWDDADDVIQIKRLTDLASHKVGCDGKMVVSLSADKSGEFTFKLLQTSPSNKFLMSLAALQGGGANTFIPVSCLFQDTFRQDVGTGTTGYIQKMPDVSRGKNASTQEWIIIVERLDLLLGNPALVGAAVAAGFAMNP